MNKKQKLAFAILGFTVIATSGGGYQMSLQYVKLQNRYAELYELAAYLAGKAEGAGVKLDEGDRIAMKALKPE